MLVAAKGIGSFPETQNVSDDCGPEVVPRESGEPSDANIYLSSTTFGLWVGDVEENSPAATIVVCRALLVR